MHPIISLVVPTLNASKEIPALLRLVELQSHPPDEVVVIDSSSDDETTQLASLCRLVKVITIPREKFDHGSTRHHAFLETKGDYVLFITQDALPASKSYIEKLLIPFEDPEVAMVSGRQLPKPDAKRFEQLVRLFNYPDSSNIRSAQDIPKLGVKTFFASDSCSAYRRTAYFECGGFERPCKTNEDMLMAATFIHAGWKVAYAANAEVLHSHNLNPVEQYRRNREIGRFLKLYSDRLCEESEVSEGGRLVKDVAKQLIHERNYSELVSFVVDCSARFLGNRSGRLSVRKESDRQ